MMWNTIFTPCHSAHHTKQSSELDTHVETCSRATHYQGTSTSLPLVRASVWVACRRTRCFNMCTHLMRRDGRIEKVWRVPLFVCNIITSPWVMTQNRVRERERVTDGTVWGLFVHVCVWSTNTCPYWYFSQYKCGIAPVNSWSKKM